MVNNFLKAPTTTENTLDAHEKSKHHLQYLLAKRAADSPSSGPLNIWARRRERERKQRIQKRISHTQCDTQTLTGEGSVTYQSTCPAPTFTGECQTLGCNILFAA